MLYIITGPAGVGKSTVSRKIAENSKKSVLIEGDEIYHQVVSGYKSAWLEGNHLRVFWKVCFETINIYLKEGYDVIFNYIINEKDLENIKLKFSNIPKKFVILMTSEEEILRRDLERPLDCQMKERTIILLRSFKEKKFDIKYYFDTTNLSINETVGEIEKNNKYTL